jgi:hypothetical protein
MRKKRAYKGNFVVMLSGQPSFKMGVAMGSTKDQGVVTRILSDQLDSELWSWEKVTHKKIGENLRCYPVITVFSVAILYLWNTPLTLFGWETVILKIAAVTWAGWIAWYTFLTLIQTFWLFGSFFPQVLKSEARIETNFMFRTRFAALLLSSVAAGFFIIGAMYLAVLIYQHSPK